jgi:hypothetical protein
MTEHAPERHHPAESSVIGPIVSGTHSPMASLFGVPTDRQFRQIPGPVAAQITAGMIPGADPIENLGFERIIVSPVKSDLMPGQVGLAVASRCGEKFFRGFVMEDRSVGLQDGVSGENGSK